MRKNYGNGAVKKAIIWAMTIMMTFTPVLGSAGSITSLAADGEEQNQSENENNNDSERNSSDNESESKNDGSDSKSESKSENKSEEKNEGKTDTEHKHDDSDKKDKEEKTSEEKHEEAEKNVQDAYKSVETAKDELDDVAHGIGDVHAKEHEALDKENKAEEALQDAVDEISKGDEEIDTTVVVEIKDKLDEDGNIVYKKNEDGSDVYEPVRDENGNFVYKLDENGNILYETDEEGNQIPVVEKQKVPEKEIITERVSATDEEGKTGLIEQANSAIEEANRELSEVDKQLGKDKEDDESESSGATDEEQKTVTQEPAEDKTEESDKENTAEVTEPAKDLHSCIDTINEAAAEAKKAEENEDYESAKAALDKAQTALGDAQKAYDAADSNFTEAKNALEKAQAAYDAADKISKEAAEEAEKELKKAIEAAEEAEKLALEAKKRVDSVAEVVNKFDKVVDETAQKIYDEWNESIDELAGKGGSVDQLIDAVDKLEGDFTSPEMQQAVTDLSQSLVELAEEFQDAEAMKDLGDYVGALEKLTRLSAQYAEARAQYTIACEAMKKIDKKVTDEDGNETTLTFKDEKGEFVSNEEAEKRLEEVNSILSTLEETISTNKKAMETLGVIYELDLSKAKTELAATKLATNTAQKAADDAQRALEEAKKTGNADMIAEAQLAADNAAKKVTEAQLAEKEAEEAVAGHIISNEMIKRENNETGEKVEAGSEEYAKFVDADGNAISYWVVKDADGKIIKRYTYEMSEGGVDVIELEAKGTDRTIINGVSYDVIDEIDVDGNVIKHAIRSDATDGEEPVVVYPDGNGGYYIHNTAEMEQKVTEVEIGLLGKENISVNSGKLDIESLDGTKQGKVDGILRAYLLKSLIVPYEIGDVFASVNEDGECCLKINYTYFSGWSKKSASVTIVADDINFSTEDFITVDGDKVKIESEGSEYYYTTSDGNKVSVDKVNGKYYTRNNIDVVSCPENEKEVYIPNNAKVYTDIQRQLMDNITKYANDKIAYDSAYAVYQVYKDSLEKMDNTRIPVVDKILDINNIEYVGELIKNSGSIVAKIKEIDELQKEIENTSKLDIITMGKLSVQMAKKIGEINKMMPNPDMNITVEEIISLGNELNNPNSFINQYINAISDVHNARKELEKDIKDGSDAVSKVAAAALEVAKAGKDIPVDSAKVAIESVKVTVQTGKVTALTGASILAYVTDQLQNSLTGKVLELQEQTNQAYVAAKAASETLKGLKLEEYSKNYVAIKELEAKLPELWNVYNQKQNELIAAQALLKDAQSTVNDISLIEEKLRQNGNGGAGGSEGGNDDQDDADNTQDKNDKPQNNGSSNSNNDSSKHHSSSKQSSSNSASSQSNDAATLTLINDEATALAATLEDTTFVPEFTTIEDEATALADPSAVALTSGTDSAMKTGDTSMIPMAATTAMAMGFALIGGGYGLKLRRRSKNNK